MSYHNVATSVRKNKEKNPEYYCSDRTCLWRVVVFDGQNQPTFKPCQKHPHLNQDKKERFSKWVKRLKCSQSWKRSASCWKMSRTKGHRHNIHRLQPTQFRKVGADTFTLDMTKVDDSGRFGASQDRRALPILWNVIQESSLVRKAGRRTILREHTAHWTRSTNGIGQSITAWAKLANQH